VQVEAFLRQAEAAVPDPLAPVVEQARAGPFVRCPNEGCGLFVRAAAAVAADDVNGPGPAAGAPNAAARLWAIATGAPRGTCPFAWLLLSQHDSLLSLSAC
jgi:hypothetical protein